MPWYSDLEIESKGQSSGHSKAPIGHARVVQYTTQTTKELPISTLASGDCEPTGAYGSMQIEF